MVFGGDGNGKADPKPKIDTTVEDSMADYNITHVSITRGINCAYTILRSIYIYIITLF